MNLPNVSVVRLSSAFEASRVSTMAAPVAAIAVSVLVLFFIVWPKFSDVLTLRSSNKELGVRAENLTAKADLLASLDRTALTQQVGYAEQLLPSDKEAFSFIRQIEVLAGASGVILNKIDVSPGSIGQANEAVPSAGVAPATGGVKTPDAAEAAPKVQLKISLTSDYNSFFNFINNLMQISRVTSIKELTIGSASTGEKAPLRTSMVVNAYWKPLPSKLGQIEESVNKLTDAEVARLARAKSVSISGGPAATASAVPQVPKGRSDLFAPF